MLFFFVSPMCECVCVLCVLQVRLPMKQWMLRITAYADRWVAGAAVSLGCDTANTLTAQTAVQARSSWSHSAALLSHLALITLFCQHVSHLPQLPSSHYFVTITG